MARIHSTRGETMKKKVEKPELLPTERLIHVELTGMPPGLLMNNPKSMLSGKKTKPGEEYVDEEEAEIRAYRNDAGNLCLLESHIKGTLLKASSFYKLQPPNGKPVTAKPVIAGCVHVWPEQIDLGIKGYKIDVRPVVIKHSRVMRARPWIPEWKAEFYIVYDRSMIGHPEQLRDVLSDAGKRVGLLDFRPEHTGTFGKFQVSRWDQ